MRIIKSGDEEYVCFEEVDSSITGYNEINETLDFVRGVGVSLLEVFGAEKKSSLKVYVYIDNEVNAFAIKQKDCYCIGISIGTFVKLRKWFDTWCSFQDTYDVLKLKCKEKGIVTDIMYNYALMFLIAHESFHILFGHCDCPDKIDKFMFEQSQQIQKDDALFEQALEMSADCGAIAFCAVRILSEEKSQSIWEEKYKMLVFAVYSIFKIFSEYEQYDFEEFIEEDLYKYDHPHAGIRFEIITQMLLNALRQMKGADFDNNIVNEYMSFECRILRYKSPKDIITSIAYTEKGANHIRKILEKWNEIECLLKGYSHMPLLHWEITGKPTAFISNEGDIIRCIGETLNTENV